MPAKIEIVTYLNLIIDINVKQYLLNNTKYYNSQSCLNLSLPLLTFSHITGITKYTPSHDGFLCIILYSNNYSILVVIIRLFKLYITKHKGFFQINRESYKLAGQL